MGNVTIVVGLLFGDESKGATVDHLVVERGATLVVRYNGGAQAAHNVVTPDGRHHTFSMFGAGTFAGARTHLSRFVRVDPSVIWDETRKLGALGIPDPYSLLSIDENCVVTTPFHVAYSQYVAGVHMRGTCGMGVGVSARYADAFPYNALYVGDFRDRRVILSKLHMLAEHYKEAVANTSVVKDVELETEVLADYYHELSNSVHITSEDDWQQMLISHDEIVFEGAQGVLLDKGRGFLPYVTSSNTTTENAHVLLEGYKGSINTVGVVRSYVTRHGAGPLPTEGLSFPMVEELHNAPNDYQGAFRQGWFDMALLQKALEINGGVDELAVSHLDAIKDDWRVAPQRDDSLRIPLLLEACGAYCLSDLIEANFGIPVRYVGYGPTRENRRVV